MLQRELSDALSIARPTATRALDGLEERGYIERRKVEGDGREVAIYPTQEALAIKRPLNEASEAVTARLKAQMGGSTFADTVHKIREVRTALE
jgi:DNA-binding MarR family transcriptional regulator